MEFRAEVKLNPRSRRDNKFRIREIFEFALPREDRFGRERRRRRRRRASGCLEFYYTRSVSPFLIDRIEAIDPSIVPPRVWEQSPRLDCTDWSEKAWSRGRGREYGRISCVTGPRKGATYGSQIWPGILPNIDRSV